MPLKCLVHNCHAPVIAKGLCQKHYMRVLRHGDVADTRPGDWGSRTSHPAYKTWCNLLRYHRRDIPENWEADFWAFTNDVPPRPEKSSLGGRVNACRKDVSKPWSKDNFYWKESIKSSDGTKEYVRQWRKRVREANPEYYADSDLRRNYGVSLAWYRETLAKQNHSCAICSVPETMQIKGKVVGLAVDHDHTSGEARGLLCSKCNRGLGLFADDEDRLEKAKRYLRSFNRAA